MLAGKSGSLAKEVCVEHISKEVYLGAVGLAAVFCGLLLAEKPMGKALVFTGLGILLLSAVFVLGGGW